MAQGRDQIEGRETGIGNDDKATIGQPTLDLAYCLTPNRSASYGSPGYRPTQTVLGWLRGEKKHCTMVDGRISPGVQQVWLPHGCIH